MSHRPTLFISHSSTVDPVQDELLRLIRQEFGTRLELLLDSDLLKPGGEWRHEINTWMGLCRAAIVIFSAGVAERPGWVRQEATILQWRESLAQWQAAQSGIAPERLFLLMPVMLPSFPREKLAEEFAPLFLERLQGAQATGASGNTAGEIMDQLRPRLEQIIAEAPTEAPLRRLANSLETLITRNHLLPDTCREAAESLGGTTALWTPGGHHQFLARTFLHADLQKVKTVLLSLKPVLKDDVAEIFDLLSEFWINPLAAVELSKVAQQPARQRAAALNGMMEATGKLYIRRAYGDYPPGQDYLVLNNAFGGDPGKEAREQVVLEFTRLNPGFREPLVLRTVELRCGPEAKEPFFILLYEPVAPSTLQQLQDALPGCTFVLLAPESFTRREEYAGVYFLQPELNPDDELLFADIQSDLNFKLRT